MLELFSLHDQVWSKYDRAWVTLRMIDSENVLKPERVYYAFGPTNRNYFNLVRNVFYATMS